jgi:hypothetical protein
MTAARPEMAATAAHPDMATTTFLLPPDAKFLPVSELSPRLRARIGPVEEGQSVITRPGFRVTTRLVPAPLADLIGEFREPSLVTDAVVRFARAHDQDPFDILDVAFDALAILVGARILVPQDSADAAAPVPGFSAGQAFAAFEIEALVRSLDDSEVYRARGRDGELAALKIVRDDRPAAVAMLANEARTLEHLDGADNPRLLEHATEHGRAYLAVEWCEGVSIAVAAQRARAARDRRRVHDLVRRMLDAYGRLHAQGVLHGDIHPGNCLVRDDGRVILLDFGHARSIGEEVMAVDPMRSGIPQFHDPQMAAELLAGQLPPAATPASEQYSIAVLAYMLLSGLHPIKAPGVQDALLEAIVERRPLPFATRGVAAWPQVEEVIGRGLARRPGERFPDVAGLAHAFAAVDPPPGRQPRRRGSAQRVFDTLVEGVRTLARSSDRPVDRAWFGLRAALALEDAELLAASDVLVGRAGTGWAAQAVAAWTARAGSDDRMERRSIAGFLAAAEPLPTSTEAAGAILAAAGLLEGALYRSEDAATLAIWAGQTLGRLELSEPDPSAESDPPVPAPLLTLVAMSLHRSGAVATPADLPARLDALRDIGVSDVWLWALAHDVVGDDRPMALAIGSRLPSKPLDRAFALLRLHQLTGDMSWVSKAERLVATAPRSRLPDLDRALLVAEIQAPEQAILPPYLVPVPRIGRQPGILRRVP